jgi:hypothetical protein
MRATGPGESPALSAHERQCSSVTVRASAGQRTRRKSAVCPSPERTWTFRISRSVRGHLPALRRSLAPRNDAGGAILRGDGPHARSGPSAVSVTPRALPGSRAVRSRRIGACATAAGLAWQARDSRRARGGPAACAPERATVGASPPGPAPPPARSGNVFGSPGDRARIDGVPVEPKVKRVIPSSCSRSGSRSNRTRLAWHGSAFLGEEGPLPTAALRFLAGEGTPDAGGSDLTCEACLLGGSPESRMDARPGRVDAEATEGRVGCELAPEAGAERTEVP